MFDLGSLSEQIDTERYFTTMKNYSRNTILHENNATWDEVFDIMICLKLFWHFVNGFLSLYHIHSIFIPHFRQKFANWQKYLVVQVDYLFTSELFSKSLHFFQSGFRENVFSFFDVGRKKSCNEIKDNLIDELLLGRVPLRFQGFSSVF